MPSYPYGKEEVCAWIRRNFPTDSMILDVGACDGAWRKLLPEYKNMDAVEIFEPYMKNLTDYRIAYNRDIRSFGYIWYDLIIFGDVIEHMSVEDAQKVLYYASRRCEDMIVAVPFLYPQDEVDGNIYQAHIQDDLTEEIFSERYPDLEPLVDTGKNYVYYHKKEF